MRRIRVKWHPIVIDTTELHVMLFAPNRHCTRMRSSAASAGAIAMDGNQLFFGDNLEVLRQHVKDDSVDLVYLDPPFNSNANYNILIRRT